MAGAGTNPFSSKGYRFSGRGGNGEEEVSDRVRGQEIISWDSIGDVR